MINFFSKNKKDFRSHYLMSKFIENAKKKLIFLVLMFCGVTTQSPGMESESFIIWKTGEQPGALRMNEVSPTFSSVSDHWRVVPSDLGKGIYEIVGFPGKNRADGTVRDYSSYRPNFSNEKAVDTLIFTRSTSPGFLDDFWVPQGFSSHVIMALDGTIFIHADILKGEKGQMAGAWNNRSFEVAFIDQGDNRCSSDQQMALKMLLNALETPRLALRFGGSIWDAKQVQGLKPEEFVGGKVANISDVLKELGLQPLGEYFEKPNDIANKYD